MACRIWRSAAGCTALAADESATCGWAGSAPPAAAALHPASAPSTSSVSARDLTAPLPAARSRLAATLLSLLAQPLALLGRHLAPALTDPVALVRAHLPPAFLVAQDALPLLGRHRLPLTEPLLEALAPLGW